MIFPKGEVLYDQLSTSFTQLDAMLDKLKGDRFTGYVQLNAPDYVGLALLVDGSLANAIEQAGGQRRHNGSAIDGILAKGAERTGTLSVFRLSLELARLLANFLQSEVLYRDLTSDLTSLDRLVGGLQSRRHSGYIEVRFPKSEDVATVFLWEGSVLESVLHRQGKVSTGPGVLQEVVRLAAAEGTVFTVYSTRLARQQPAATPPEGPGRQEQLALWQEVLRTIETAADAATKTGAFLAAFRRAGIDLAASFPFLDPFAGEFEYRDGHMRFDGEEPAAAFNQGLCRCLAHCTRTLAAQPGARDVQARIAAAANGLKKRHGGRVAELGLSEALPELFG